MFCTNLGDSDHEIIDLYLAHGECELFHSEIKTDMDVERLPSGKSDTDELVLDPHYDRLQHPAYAWSGNNQSG